jgi:mono/diheme cytochrome c family protein
MRITTPLAAVLAALLLAPPAPAQEAADPALRAGTTLGTPEGPGRREYMNSCASCHGASGKGDGPLAELMTVEVPDLTTIAERNGGRFPMDEVIEIIDGRTGVRGHGYPMPVWGRRYEAEAGRDYGPWGSGAELFVRSRILALAYHLQSMQE